MTRDELETELETLLIGTPKMADVMDVIDSYAATQRAEIEQQIEAHVQRRVAIAEQRIIDAIKGGSTDE